MNKAGSRANAIATAIVAMIMLIIGAMVCSIEAGAASTDITLTFSDSGVTAAGGESGFEISGTDLKITDPGVYRITGSCAEGSVTVKKEVQGVTLILEDLDLTCTTTAPISCNKSTDVVIQVEGNNTLTDGEDLANEAEEDFEGAGIKVKSGASLKLTGSGTLTVNGNCKNGIKGAATASVTVTDLTLNVNAESNALASDGSVTIESGVITAVAKGDGIKSDPDDTDSESAGIVVVNGGTITITSDEDGIQATCPVTIQGGTLTITAGGGYGEATGAKGIKSDDSVNIYGGSIAINCSDDGIHAGEYVTIAAGELTIQAGDDGIHADYVVNVGEKNAASGPDITISTCEEGMEGAAVNLYSGKASITARDDGINAANSELSNYEFSISVYDGSWYINADGDAMDSNQDINIYGGVTECYGAPNSGNSALDYDGSCTVEKGTLVTVDCAGMNQLPSGGTYVLFGQASMMGGGMPGDTMSDTGDVPAMQDGMTPPDQNGGGPNGGQPGETNEGTQPGGTVDNSAINIQAGSAIEVKDNSGNPLYTGTGAKTANCVMLASDSLTEGETYTLYVDGAELASAQAQTGNGQGGTTPGGQPGQNQEPQIQPGQYPEPPVRPGQNTEDPDQPEQPGSETQITYTDVPAKAWYHDAVQYVTNHNMMNGTGADVFSPKTNTTRGMIVTILYRLEGSPEVSRSGSYTDVKETAYYSDAVEWATENNIVNGFGDGTFAPKNDITREQMATILYRYAQYKGYDVGAQGQLTDFTDGTTVRSYAHTAMSWACGANLIQGSGDKLLPREGATRAQTATILQRFCETVAK